MTSLELPADQTLRLYAQDQVLFASDRRWLHPLFDLEAFFAESGTSPQGTRLVDRVTGRAAAFLMARLGLPSLQTGLLSRLAIPVLERHGIAWEAQQVVDRITCATEQELQFIEDPEQAYALLQVRRQRALTRP
jgi:zinc transport system ATP-binding protein